MIVCDQVITEAKTNKKSLIGTFNKLVVGKLPATLHKFYVFIALTNGAGPYRAQLKCVNESAEGKPDPVFELEGPISFGNPMETVELAFKLANLTFMAAGTHAIELWCDDDLIIQRRLVVEQREKT